MRTALQKFDKNSVRKIRQELYIQPQAHSFDRNDGSNEGTKQVKNRSEPKCKYQND